MRFETPDLVDCLKYPKGNGLRILRCFVSVFLHLCTDERKIKNAFPSLSPAISRGHPGCSDKEKDVPTVLKAFMLSNVSK